MLISLNTAAQGPHTNVVDVLTSRGADVNSRDEGGKTALHIFAQNYRDTSTFTQVAETLLSAGANIDAVDKKGDTVLNRLAERGDSGAVKFMLDNKAKITSTSICNGMRIFPYLA